MKILGIESSCDETACAVVEDGRKVLSNIVATSLEEHKLYGGVVPEIASRRHAESISGVVKEALEKADCTMDDIEAIAVTYAPGLIVCNRYSSCARSSFERSYCIKLHFKRC